MDSLHKAELVVSLERASGTEIAPEEAAQIDCVRDVMRMLNDRHSVS
jgi:acyl carrier protein